MPHIKGTRKQGAVSMLVESLVRNEGGEVEEEAAEVEEDSWAVDIGLVVGLLLELFLCLLLLPVRVVVV